MGVFKELQALLEGAQYQVDLGVPPAVKKSGAYAQWQLTKQELKNVINNWDNVSWDQRSISRPSTEGSFHSTAITRNKPPKPIADYLANNEVSGEVLYHGVGRDEAGAEALGADRYDKYHTDPEITKEPNKVYNEIHSHYTLNVVDKDEGLKILNHIYKLLSSNGKAVISVRRDLKSKG